MNTYVGIRVQDGKKYVEEKIGIVEAEPVDLLRTFAPTHRLYSYAGFIRPTIWVGAGQQTGLVLTDTTHKAKLSVDELLQHEEVQRCAFADWVQKENKKHKPDPTFTLAHLSRQLLGENNLRKQHFNQIKYVIGEVTDRELYNRILTQS